MTLKIDSRTDWTEELLRKAWLEIEKIAEEELELRSGIELYPNQFEIVSAEQMLDAYSSIGLPVNYNHWSFGKEFLRNEQAYGKGRMGLAYEMVINSNPCINLLMEENLALTQVMVMAHAGVGHNAVFANNAYFKQWTHASNIIDYMLFARDYIRSCEERYGLDEVELMLDACHSIASHSIDKYKRKHQQKLSDEERLRRLMEEDERKQSELDIVLKKTTIVSDEQGIEEDDDAGEENILYFIMKKSPSLKPWQREICRIVYKVNQYFSPQGPTKTLNEGYATFCHYYIMQRLEEKGIITPDAYIAYLNMHAGVIFQPDYSSRYYSGPNPYALGFNIFRDIKRICEHPTAEDKEWFPQLIGRRWQDVTKEAAFEYRDDSFIQQFLSPKVIRDMRLFTVNMQYDKDQEFGGPTVSAIVKDIHDEQGYAEIRTDLSRSKERINYVPHITVDGADLEGDRTLRLRYHSYRDRGLHENDGKEVLQYLDYLWGYRVTLTTA